MHILFFFQLQVFLKIKALYCLSPPGGVSVKHIYGFQGQTQVLCYVHDRKNNTQCFITDDKIDYINKDVKEHRLKDVGCSPLFFFII